MSRKEILAIFVLLYRLTSHLRMSNIELFNQDNKIGDIVVIYLNSGKDISGEVVEIGDNYILLKKEDGKQMRLFENIIGAWETISSSELETVDVFDGGKDMLEKVGDSTSPSIDTDSAKQDSEAVSSPDEPQRSGLKILGKIDLSKFNDPRYSFKKEDIKETDIPVKSEPPTAHEQVEVAEPQEAGPSFFESQIKACVKDLKDLFQESHVDLGKLIEVNTTVKANSSYKGAFGVGISDDGDTLLIREEGFVGNPEVLSIEGSKLFCRPQNGESPKLSFVSIAQMTYGELLDHFEQCIEDEWIVKAISILKSLRMFDDFSPIDNQLRDIYVRLKSASRKVYQKSIIDVYELTEEEEARLESFIKEKIEAEDKRRPLQDIQIKNAYTYKYRVRVSMDAFEKAREKAGFLSSEYRVQEECPFIKDYESVKMSLEDLNKRFDIDKETLLYHLDAVASELEPHFDINDKPNAFVQKVGRNSCIVNYNAASMRCFYNSVLDLDLLKRLSEFSEGELPVRVSTYVRKKTGETYISNIVDVLSIREHITNLIHLVEDENYVYARRYNQNIQSFIQPYLTSKGVAHYKQAIGIFKRAVYDISDLPIIVINFSNKIQAEQEVSKKAALAVFQIADEHLSKGNAGDAIEVIKSAIETGSFLPKDQSLLYQRLIQIYTTADKPEDAIDTYKRWISYGEEKDMFTVKKLSRIYTDLARIQYSTPGHEQDALESLKIAIEYNPDNKLSLSLQEQISTALEDLNSQSGQELQVAPESRVLHSIDVVSDMLDLDIQEHRYTDKRILSNGSPTIEIATQLLEEAKSTDDVESYPVFLETAKAFHDLKFYNHQDYLYVVACYARLKGNFLFKTFKKSLQSINYARSPQSMGTLCRLKDSAQSYYMESLNLWSFISFEDEDEDNDISTKEGIDQVSIVLEILVNHMILDVAYYQASQQAEKAYNYDALFNMQFKDVFYNCMRSNDESLHGIAASTIVKVGSYSSAVWNRLASHPNGISGLYGELTGPDKRLRFYSSINKAESASTSIELSPKEFLQQSFAKHSSDRYEFAKQIAKLREEVLSPHGMDNITSKWRDLDSFYRLLSPTDMESTSKVDEILTILKPYPYRGDDEQSTLLYQVTEIIDEQIKFINVNTTFYGRTFFFPLLTKWAGEIRNIRKERVAIKQPRLSVAPDPHYILETDQEKKVSLVIKNSGETTAEGFSIDLVFTSLQSEESYEYSNEIKTEIPSGQIAAFTISLNNDVDYSKGINLRIGIAPIYQGNVLNSVEASYTIEEEPKSVLEPDDVIWSDGPITPKPLFFGRQELIDKLVRHYLSSNRHKPYILYGLTRTGKSSIVKYLGLQITGKTTRIQGQQKTILHFSMDLDEAGKCPNAKEVWDFFIRRCLYEKICKYAGSFSLDCTDYKPSDHPRSYEFEDILKKLSENGFYPFITMDEFSHMKTLIKTGKLTSAFLHTLRKYSFEGLASFMYIGTYDINDLLTDKEYGITGQLTHCINYQLNEIDEKPAKQLINVLGDKLIFTDEAQDYICRLSGRVPYFIQIICQNCGKYAIEKKRRFIGYPELLEVVKVLTGEIEIYDDDSELQRLTINTFEDNQYSANDPNYVLGLVVSISYLNRECDQNNVPPKGIRIDELERLWTEYGIKNAKYYIGEAINILKAKQIIVQNNEDVVPSYTIIVDLYRRWCKIEYPDINLVLSSLLNQDN